MSRLVPPRRLAVLTAVALAVPACGTVSAAEQPAVIAQPTESSRSELLRVVTAAFNGRPVTIADDALTRDSVLTIERREPRDLEGRPFGGRVLEAPEQFQLVLRDAECELVRQSDGRRWRLSETRCVPNVGGVAE
jgi:hypothetical protein